MAKKEKQPMTPAEINRKNQEFWAVTTKKFESSINKRPHDAVIAATQSARLVARLTAAFGQESADTAISASESMEQLVADLAESHSANQSTHAKKPRKNRRSKCKAVTVRAMRSARADDQTLNDFLEAAAVGSIDGLTITELELGGIKRYEVDVYADDQQKRIARSTIEQWWAEATMG